MAKTFYVGVNDIARNVKQPYCEANEVARTIKKGYIGVNDVARETFAPSGLSGWFTFYDSPSFPSGSGVKTYSFPFTTLDGFNFSSIVIDDSNMASIYDRMYFDNTLVYSQIWEDGYSSNYPNYWREANDKSIYLDNLEIGVDISEESYAFLLAVAYPDKTISGKPQTYFLEAGTYTFNDTIVSGAFAYNYSSPVISLSMTINLTSGGAPATKFEYYYYMDMIDSHTIYYTWSDGTREWVYDESWGSYEDGTTGWKADKYKAIILSSDIQVSKSVYDWWTLNTTKS